MKPAKKSTSKKVSLKQNISKLICTLEHHQQTHNRNEKWLVIVTALLVIATAMLVFSEFENAYLSKRADQYAQTIEMCRYFDDRIDNPNLETNRQEFGLWLTNDPIWIKTYPDPEERMDRLWHNPVVRKFFSLMEDAKNLAEDQRLEKSYFYNKYNYTFASMQNAQKPSLSEFLSYAREKPGAGKDLWDGFDYCWINIISPMREQEGIQQFKKGGGSASRLVR